MSASDCPPPPQGTATVEVVALNRLAILRDASGDILTDAEGETLFDDSPGQL